MSKRYFTYEVSSYIGKMERIVSLRDLKGLELIRSIKQVIKGERLIKSPSLKPENYRDFEV